MARKTAVPPGPRDEKGVLAARILEVARDLFAENGWAGTTIRGVARIADVDPALVYHYFKSKEALLDACTTLPPDFTALVSRQWTDNSDASFGVNVVRSVVAQWGDERLKPVLRAILLIAAHEPRTLEKLKHEISALQPFQVNGDGDEQRTIRSAVVASQLVGFCFMRYVWQVEPFASMTDDEVVAALAPTFDHHVDAHHGAPPRLSSVLSGSN